MLKTSSEKKIILQNIIFYVFVILTLGLGGYYLNTYLTTQKEISFNESNVYCKLLNGNIENREKYKQNFCTVNGRMVYNGHNILKQNLDFKNGCIKNKGKIINIKANGYWSQSFDFFQCEIDGKIINSNIEI